MSDFSEINFVHNISSRFEEALCSQWFFKTRYPDRTGKGFLVSNFYKNESLDIPPIYYDYFEDIKFFKSIDMLGLDKQGFHFKNIRNKSYIKLWADSLNYCSGLGNLCFLEGDAIWDLELYLAELNKADKKVACFNFTPAPFFIRDDYDMVTALAREYDREYEEYDLEMNPRKHYPEGTTFKVRLDVISSSDLLIMNDHFPDVLTRDIEYLRENDIHAVRDNRMTSVFNTMDSFLDCLSLYEMKDSFLKREVFDFLRSQPSRMIQEKYFDSGKRSFGHVHGVADEEIVYFK